MSQLELFVSTPFSVRLAVTQALQMFWDNDWCHTAKAKKTRKTFGRLNQYFSSCYVDEVGKDDVEDLRRFLSNQGLAPATINTHHMIVTRLYNWLNECRDKGKVAGVDFTKIPLPRRNPGTLVKKINELQFAENSPWPKAVVYKLIGVCHRLGELYMAHLIEILYLTRLRLGDVGLMTHKNVDLAHMAIAGTQHKTICRKTPSGIPYYLALTRRGAVILKLRMDQVGEGKYLFRDENLTVEAWERQLNRRFAVIKKMANLPHVKMKHFRSSSATLLMDNGIDPKTVSEMLGHTSMRMLPVYARRTMLHQRKAQAVLEDEHTEIIV